MRGEVDAIRVIDAPLPNNWESATFYSLLKEGSLDLVQDGNHGGSYPKAEEFESSGVPLITGADLNDGAINLKDCKFLKPTSAEKLRIGFAKQGDVLLTHKGTMGKTAIVPPLPCPYIILNPQITLYRVSRNGRLNNRFLKYFFDGAPFQAFLERISGISTISTLSLTVQKSIEIPVPPLPEQRAIAHILGTLDDKIELNRRRNQTLEAMARALFQDWFVDFGPVRAKMEGRAPYLPADLWRLFPDRLDEDGKPEGWIQQTVGDIGELICGKTPSTKVPEYYGDDIPFITIPEMHGKIFATDIKKRLSHKGANSQAKKMLPPGAICVSCIATLGLVVITTEPSQTNQQINSIVPDQENETYFWYWTLKNLGEEIKAGGSGGSVLGNLSTGRFSNLQVNTSTRPLRLAYNSRVESLFSQILINESESQTLAQLRDTLLPKLISGELRIADAEKFMERAA